MRVLVLVSLLAALAFGALGAPTGPLPARIGKPSLLVLKSKRELRLFSGEALLRTYRIGLGTNPVPPKVRAGDRATPEGTYFVCIKNPKSAYYLSLGLNYPNEDDAERGLRDRLISKAQYAQVRAAARRKAVPPWNTPLGGEIFIHGNGAATDWTWGCVALEDTDMAELFRVIPVGTPVRIVP